MAKSRRNNGGFTAGQIIGGIAAAGSIVALGATVANGQRSANVSLPNQIDSTEVAKIIKNDPQAFQFLRATDGINGTNGIDGMRVLSKTDITGQITITDEVVQSDIFYVLTGGNYTTTQTSYNGVVTVLPSASNTHILKFDTTKSYKIVFYVNDDFGNSHSYEMPKLQSLAGVDLVGAGAVPFSTLVPKATVKAAKGTFFVMSVKNGILALDTTINVSIPYSFISTKQPGYHSADATQSITQTLVNNGTIQVDNFSVKTSTGARGNIIKIGNNVDSFVLKFSPLIDAMDKTTFNMPDLQKQDGTPLPLLFNDPFLLTWDLTFDEIRRYNNNSTVTFTKLPDGTFEAYSDASYFNLGTSFSVSKPINIIKGTDNVTITGMLADPSFLKDYIYEVVNCLDATKTVTINFGAVPQGYTAATSIVIKRMDTSTTIAPEQTEFKGSVRFLYSSELNKFIVIP